mgnify:CR=1 FL=1
MVKLLLLSITAIITVPHRPMLVKLDQCNSDAFNGWCASCLQTVKSPSFFFFVFVCCFFFFFFRGRGCRRTLCTPTRSTHAGCFCSGDKLSLRSKELSSLPYIGPPTSSSPCMVGVLVVVTALHLQISI